MLDFEPFCTIAATMTISPTASGVPLSVLTPGAAAIMFMVALSTPLESSLSAPFRITIAWSSLPELPRVFWMPADSIIDDDNTYTTSAMPSTAAMVVARRCCRLRML